ncbi:hypothetical protein M9H77_30273 [Catharanthus roseus]|uniref:Uncharacterized protein n=1 Tax=Catharanthus roseus TaxID=4058 RepID=A0ACC0A0P7_CATRO|nr:hypothetical protein M9H77_30273 [Catharanthus roseus]
MESLMVKEFPKNKELSQTKIEESLKIHVEDEISKEEPCCILNEKSIEIKQKERVEEKEGLNFEDSSKDEGGKLSLGTLLEEKQLIESNSNYCAIPRVNECHFNIANYVSYVLGIEEKGRNMEKELDNFLKDLLINHVLHLDEKTSMKLIKYIHSKNHDVVHANNKKLGMQYLVFESWSWISRTNLFKRVANDVHQESQEAKDLLHGPFTSARPKKIKDNDGNMDNGVVSYMEEALKNKLEEFEGQGKASNDQPPIVALPVVVGRLLPVKILKDGTLPYLFLMKRLMGILSHEAIG